MRWPKKELEVLTMPGAKKEGWRVTAACYKDILLLAVCKNRAEAGRYAIDQTGRHEFWNGKTWGACSLQWAAGGYWGPDITPDSRADGETICRFFGDPNSKNSPIRRIICREEEYNSTKRVKALERKAERIKKRMEEVPEIPDNFLSWAESRLPDYGLIVGNGFYYCTACGRIEAGKPKANKEMVCTGGKRITGTRRKQVVLKEKFLLLQSAGENCVARYFDVQARYTRDAVYLSRMETIRMFMGKTGEKELKIYYEQWRREESDQTWWDTNPFNWREGTAYCYPEGVKEALKETRYEGLGIPYMAAKGWKLQYNNLMANYPIAKPYEYIAKMGLCRLLREETEKRMGIWGNRTDLCLTGKTAEEVLKIDMQRIRRLRDAGGGECYLQWMRLEEVNKVFNYRIPEEAVRFLEKNNIYPGDLNFIRNRMTDAKSAHYIEKQMRQYKKKAAYIIGQWKDYLSMAERLGMDVYDEIVFKPKELLRRHDALLEIINEKNEDEQADKMRQKFPRAEGNLRKIKTLYEYEGEDFIITVPSTIKQIMADSRELHHCAGASERYYERIEANETYIMFLRKKSRPQHAWYTLEVEPGGTVRQKRSEFNRQPELERVNKCIREWQEALKDRLDGEQKKLKEESRLRRLEEMKQLKESESARDNQLYDLLSGDLLEAI